MHFRYFAIQSSVFFLQVCVKKYISALLPISKTREGRKKLCEQHFFALHYLFAPNLASELARCYPFCTPFWRQNAVGTTLGEKWQRWIVLKRTAIVAIFC